MPNEYDLMNRQNVLGKPGAKLDDLMGSMTGQQLEPERQIVEVAPENALIHREDGTIIYKRFVLNPIGLGMPMDCTPEEWRDVGKVIKSLDTVISWVIGDWALYAMNNGMTASEVAKEFGYETGTIETYVWVCSQIHGSIRNRALSFGHHREVVKFREDEQIQWLEIAARQGWTIAQFHKAIYGVPPKPTENWQNWRASSGRLEKALKGKLDLSQDEFESELQKFVNQARVLWARRCA